MKKKAMCLIMTAVMILSCAGCGKTEENKNPESTVASTTEETITKEETTKNEAEVSENSPESVSENGFLKVAATTVNLRESDEERDRYRIVNVKYTKFSLEEESAKEYPALAKTLDEFNQHMDEANKSELSYLKDSYMENETEWDDENYPTYSDETSSYVLRADKNVLSILKYNYYYEGGAHGDYGVTGVAYDVTSGQSLMLLDVITDESVFVGRLKEKLNERYSDVSFFEDMDTYFTSEDFGLNELHWSIDYNGVTVYFQPYELASFADGVLTARFSFAENADIMNQKYTSIPDEYVTPVTRWTEAYADLNNDGKEEDILLVGNVLEDGWDMCNWSLKIGDETIEDRYEAFENESYLVKKNGKFYTYMFKEVEDDYAIMSIIDLESKKHLLQNDDFSNYDFYELDFGYDDTGYWQTKSSFVNPDSVLLDSRMDVFGTYGAMKEYHVGDDGLLHSDDELFRVDYMGYLITPVHDITCKIVDKDGNILEENAVLPKDTMLRIVRTNGENMADLQAGDYYVDEKDIVINDDYCIWRTEEPIDLNRGVFYRVEYEINDYERTIDGESIFDVFRGMMFAG